MESDIRQRKFKDIFKAANTSLGTVLHRYIREKLQHKQDKKRERSKFNVILRSDIVKRMLTELRTSDFAKYRDAHTVLGITNFTINRELSSINQKLTTFLLERVAYILSKNNLSYVLHESQKQNLHLVRKDEERPIPLKIEL